MRDTGYTWVSITPASAWWWERSSPRGIHLPALVPKDGSRTRVHQVRFSICREEVWQDRVARKVAGQLQKEASNKDRGLGREGLGVKGENVWNQRGAQTGIHQSDQEWGLW